MSKLPQDQVEWKVIELMLSAGDAVLVYQEAAFNLSENSINQLSNMLTRDVTIHVCAEKTEQTLPDTFQKIDWPKVVELVESSQGVNSL